MAKIYLIKHVYDVDGGFGDAIQQEEIIGYLTSEKEAAEYCNMYSKPFIYDSPYHDLYKGELIYEKLPNQLNLNVPPFDNSFYNSYLDDEDDDQNDYDFDYNDNND